MACSCKLIRPAKYAQGKEPVAAVNGPCALQIYGQMLRNQHTLYRSAAWAGLRLAPATVGNRSFFCFHRLCAEAVHAVSRPLLGVHPT